MTTFDANEKKYTFENSGKKGENTGDQYFLLFPQFFYHLKYKSNVSGNTQFSSANEFNMNKDRIAVCVAW